MPEYDGTNDVSAHHTTEAEGRKSWSGSRQGSHQADVSFQQETEKVHFENLHRFVAEFKKVIPGLIAKNPKYDRVKVLFCYWEHGEPDMKEEAKGLMRLFRDDYGFGVEEFIIPANERATISFNAFLPAQIIKHEDEEGGNKLLILYYGGHGHWDRHSNKHYWKPVQDRSHALSDVSMPLRTMRDNLQLVNCDLLLLFDCCYSLAMMGEDFVGKRRAWLLAAAGNVEKASGTPGKTWTAAITKELEQLKDSGGVSASQLNDILTRSEKMLRTYKLTATPFIRRYSAPSFLSDISIEVIKKQSSGNDVSGVIKQPEKLQTDARMLIKIAFRNPADELKRSLWEYWFATRPPNFSEVEFAILKQIEIVDLFETNSCVLLVTMPVSLWAFFPPHPAYDCIDMVRSRKNLLLDGPGPQS